MSKFVLFPVLAFVICVTIFLAVFISSFIYTGCVSSLTRFDFIGACLSKISMKLDVQISKFLDESLFDISMKANAPER